VTVEKWRGRGILPKGFSRVGDYLDTVRGGIKPEKIREIQEKVPEVVSSFSKSHKAFLRKLKAMIA
jgi:hypothetical protein